MQTTYFWVASNTSYATNPADIFANKMVFNTNEFVERWVLLHEVRTLMLITCLSVWVRCDSHQTITRFSNTTLVSFKAPEWSNNSQRKNPYSSYLWWNVWRNVHSINSIVKVARFQWTMEKTWTEFAWPKRWDLKQAEASWNKALKKHWNWRYNNSQTNFSVRLFTNLFARPMFNAQTVLRSVYLVFE